MNKTMAALAALLVFIVGWASAEFFETLPFAGGDSDTPPNDGYLCCAIALDTSRAGALLNVAGFLIGIATAALICYKIWAGIRDVRDKESRRAIRWACGFISKELLLTVNPSSKKSDEKRPRLLQSEYVASVVKLLGEFFEAVRSGDEEVMDRIQGQLGEARSELEMAGWAQAAQPSNETNGRMHSVFFLYEGENEFPMPPEIGNWRASGRVFSNPKDAMGYCRNLMKVNPNISKVMLYDVSYGSWTTIRGREKMLGKEDSPAPSDK